MKQQKISKEKQIADSFDCWRPPYCADIFMAFNDVIKFSDVSLNDGLHDGHYNQCVSNMWEFSIFTLPWVG